MRPNKKTALAGVTLTELIVVLAIVSLLATLAVPVAISRSREARFAIAQSEVQAYGTGEEIVGITHGVYLPLQLLDNIPTVLTGRDGLRTDDMENETDPISLIQVDVNSAQQISQGQVLFNGGSVLATSLETGWTGPFVQPQRVFVNPSITPPNATLERRDHPLDPWGNAYRLYSPEGIVGSTVGTNPLGSPATVSDMDSTSFSNGRLTNTDDRFDRYAVVSFGPDGVSDGPNPGTDADDIVYFFGTLVRRTDSLP